MPIEELTEVKEKHRPQWHFSPDSMWMNDPNGMVYYEGEYHLFYQYYPDSTVWGPMHWGHAVSNDLINWEHLPVALYPDSLGYIFSGSAVVDWQNTSGFGSFESPPLVAVFTYHDPVGADAGESTFQTQGVAYSLDKGRTWEKYSENPVIPNEGIKDFRDPKVFWHEASSQWVMILAVYDHVKIYNSPDLKSWELVSEFGKDQGSHGGVWECPDLFALEDENGKSVWTMIVSLGDGGPNGGSGTLYFLGDFDGQTFTNYHEPDQVLWLDYGRDNYAGVTWSDIPSNDGRRIFMGWMSNWKYAQVVPTDNWRSAMTIPRSLVLKTTAAGLRLVASPVEELSQITLESMEIDPQNLEAGEKIKLDSLNTGLIRLDLTCSMTDSASVELVFANEQGEEMIVGYQQLENQYFTDRRNSGKTGFSEDFSGRHIAPRIADDSSIHMTVLLDVSSVELFADGGEVVMTDIMFPHVDYSNLEIRAVTSGVNIERLTVSPLKPAKIQ